MPPAAPTKTPAPRPAPSPAAERERAIDDRAGRVAARVTGGARTVAAPGGPSWVNDGAGLILGAVGWALALNWLRYGAAGARGWLSAKFLNKPMKAQTGGGTAVGKKLADKANAAAKAGR